MPIHGLADCGFEDQGPSGPKGEASPYVHSITDPEKTTSRRDAAHVELGNMSAWVTGDFLSSGDLQLHRQRQRVRANFNRVPVEPC